MNAVTLRADLRAQPFAAETFEAFHLFESGELRLMNSFPTFDDALQMATVSTLHKGKFAIRRTDTLTGAALLHLYVVKQKSKPTYVYQDYQTTRVNQLYAEHLLDLKLDALGSVA